MILFCFTCNTGSLLTVFPIPILCDIAVIHFTYPHAVITQYIVTITNSNNYFLDQLGIRKYDLFDFYLFLQCSSILYVHPSFNLYHLLTEEKPLTFFTGQVCRWWLFLVFVCLRKYFSLTFLLLFLNYFQRNS